MSDQTAPLPPLSDAEARAFVGLGLTPGNWAALGPAPLLLRTDLRRPMQKDFPLLRELAALIGDDVGPTGNAEGFWSRCVPSMSTEVIALLGWHLAHGVERVQREKYLALLDESAEKFIRTTSPSPVACSVSSRVREAMEESLSHTTFAVHLPPIRHDLANFKEVGNLFNDMDWKQATVGDGLQMIATGLAALPVSERRRILESLWKIMRQCVPSSPRVANDCVDELRKLVEENLRSARSEPASNPTDVPILPELAIQVDPLPPVVEPAPQPVARSSAPPTRHTRPMIEVVTPTDFTPLTFAQAMERANATSVAQIREWLSTPESSKRFLFDDCRQDCAEVAILTDPATVPQSLWVIGDVHADVLSLANIIENADCVGKQEGREPHFVFLGDFVDRGRYDHETLLLLFGLIMRNPGRVCIIPGNHDIDLRWGDKARKFGVTIQPAEYCERLNGFIDSEQQTEQEQVELAQLMIEFWKTRPKAVFLPDGTMFSHGGFPHTDVHDSLKTRADLGAKKCVDDFLWARLSESMKKRPNRGNRGHEFGWKDFAQFCRVMNEQLGIPVQRLIRGHDHVAARWLLPADYQDNPVLTINAMGWRLDGEPEPTDGPHPYPVVARHAPDSLPLIVRLRLDPREVDLAQGKNPSPGSADAECDSTPQNPASSVQSYALDSPPRIDPEP